MQVAEPGGDDDSLVRGPAPQLVRTQLRTHRSSELINICSSKPLGLGVSYHAAIVTHMGWLIFFFMQYCISPI